MRKYILAAVALLALSAPTIAADVCPEATMALVEQKAKERNHKLLYAPVGVIQSFINELNNLQLGPVVHGDKFAIISVPNEDRMWVFVIKGDCLVVSYGVSRAVMQQMAKNVVNAGS